MTTRTVVTRTHRAQQAFIELNARGEVVTQNFAKQAALGSKDKKGKKAKTDKEARARRGPKALGKHAGKVHKRTPNKKKSKHK